MAGISGPLVRGAHTEGESIASRGRNDHDEGHCPLQHVRTQGGTKWFSRDPKVGEGKNTLSMYSSQ